jgi:SLT domain-containing protein
MSNEPLGFTYTGEDFQPNTITFNSAESTWVMQITADRKIIVNEDVEVSEAAQSVLDALQPLLLQTNPVKELTDEEIADFTHRMVLCCGVHPNSADINVLGLKFIVEDILRKAKE